MTHLHAIIDTQDQLREAYRDAAADARDASFDLRRARAAQLRATSALLLLEPEDAAGSIEVWQAAHAAAEADCRAALDLHRSAVAEQERLLGLMRVQSQQLLA